MPVEEVFRSLLLARNFICGVGVVARTSCYRRVGKFDESLDRSQDYEMWIQRARHFKGFPSPQSTVDVREHSGPHGAASYRFDAAGMGRNSINTIA